MHPFVRSAILVLCVTPLGASRPAQSPEFARFVDRYLDDFASRHPSIAAGNGIHQHDGRLDAFSPAAIATEISALRGNGADLRAFDPNRLTPDERVDRRILTGVIDGWLLEQETLENWRRNPMLYASALADGVHNLMTMGSNPAPVRMRRIVAKLEQVPAFLTAARSNIANPPRLFAERGAAMMKGARDMLGRDPDLAFAAEPNAALRDSLRRAANAAIAVIDAYIAHLERDVIPEANGDFTIGAANLARRYLAEELIDTPLDTMVAIGERELARSQAEFRAAAAKLAPGRDPVAVWQEVRRDHPKLGVVVAATRTIVDSLSAFVTRRGIAALPLNERVIVEPAQPFDLGFASMHASPPLESTPVKSIHYITDAQPGLSPAEQNAWLERYNYASLSNTSADEAMPGHWLHSTYMRRTPGKVRRIWVMSNGIAPIWAHRQLLLPCDTGAVIE